MMIKYWDYVVNCQIDAVKKKWMLCKPIRKIIADYKNVFHEYFQKWLIDDLQASHQKTEEALAELREQREVRPREDDDDDGNEDEEDHYRLLSEAVRDRFHNEVADRPDPKLWSRTWFQTLPGQLEMALIKLTDSYNVFSFYG